MNGSSKTTLGSDSGVTWAEVPYRKVTTSPNVKAVSMVRVNNVSWVSYWTDRQGRGGRVTYNYSN